MPRGIAHILLFKNLFFLHLFVYVRVYLCVYGVGVRVELNLTPFPDTHMCRSEDNWSVLSFYHGHLRDGTQGSVGCQA